ncbi:HTH lysR-type domain-containing protein [Bordetella tumbae]|uniref:LysR substrate-binding domain-containing protein n=1 Tax=Bordetella tumbae TaxID=1649139 RepID=UPI0039F11597
MTLQQLRDFIAIADIGSLRGAASSRGVTGPALAKSVRLLEEELHVALLERRSRGMVLTEDGMALLAHARLIDSQSRKAIEDLAQRRGKQEGSLVLGVGPSAGVALMPGVLKDFQRKYPAVQIDMFGGSYYDHIGPILQGSIDLAIVAVPETRESNLDAEHLFYNDLAVICRRGHPLSGARSLAELVDCVWILTGPAGRGPGSAILEAFKQLGLPAPTRLLQCDMTWTLNNLLVKSDMLCALPRIMIEQPALSGALQALHIVESLPHYSISLLKRGDAPLLPIADYMATLIRRHAHYLGEDSRRSAQPPLAAP